MTSLLAYFLMLPLEAALFKLFNGVCSLLRLLSGLFWRPVTPVGGGCVGRNELRLLTACTARHDDNKLKKFRIASKRPNQDV